MVFVRFLLSEASSTYYSGLAINIFAQLFINKFHNFTGSPYDLGCLWEKESLEVKHLLFKL